MTEILTTIAALQRALADAPQRPFLLFEGRAYSYATVAAAASRWATHLRAAGVERGDRVALYLENSPAFVAAYLGAHMIGAIVVLINTQYRYTELRHILSDSEARVIIVGNQTHADLVCQAQEDARTIRADAVVLEGTGDMPDWTTAPAPHDIALLGYTSGTTGRSKGAMLTHANLMANSAAVTRAWHWTERDRLLLTLPLFHIHGLGVGLNGTLFTASTVDLRRGFDAVDVLDTLARGETTMFFGVPTMYTRLITEARRRLAEGAPFRVDAVRLFVSGSAPLTPRTFAEFEELFGQRILERYGMTETIMNLTNPYDGERRPGTVGMPFPGQEARIVDVRTRQPLPDGVIGEIQVRGPNVFAGYWRNPQATAEAFDADGWFNTGDLGWRSADGYFVITGRARELIISGGYNIYPREVEEVLLDHPAVAEVAVVGLPDPEFGEQVVAVVVPTAQPRDGLEQELIDWCRARMASYKKPRRVIFVATLPRNALGKVQKHLLQQQLQEA
ncbi:MAG: acyl-CoA synthetase [Roseiflexus sp.]|jgi:malonyl-CoA/methylmalonyl-CoA synthetase|nr:acyl-CoA synthetase [Roseiflexus sp.]MBO9365601.1 acyl-CoA synthetase [Roseiflexus sp.]MBO9382937.1 acyl-CoA synthetase [Roseiflexus sp.]MBO9390201.1 acyl-CoA synthetase [Roseiflexus sp.]